MQRLNYKRPLLSTWALKCTPEIAKNPQIANIELSRTGKYRKPPLYVPLSSHTEDCRLFTCNSTLYPVLPEHDKGKPHRTSVTFQRLQKRLSTPSPYRKVNIGLEG